MAEDGGGCTIMVELFISGYSESPIRNMQLLASIALQTTLILQRNRKNHAAEILGDALGFCSGFEHGLHSKGLRHSLNPWCSFPMAAASISVMSLSIYSLNHCFTNRHRKNPYYKLWRKFPFDKIGGRFQVKFTQKSAMCIGPYILLHLSFYGRNYVLNIKQLIKQSHV